MRLPETSWIARAIRRVRSPALVLLCCALGGCHSTSFESILGEPRAARSALSRATLGGPVAPHADEPTTLRQTAAQENGPDPLAGSGPDQFIDLATALTRAGVDNPTIALAEEAVRVSLAERMQARALLFPTLDVGTNLRLHRGNFLSGRGVITDTNIQSMYWGFGADAKGSGTLAVPGLRLVSHLADAIYAPQAAQQKVVQSRYDATATRHYVLMEVGVRYLALVEAQARLEAYRQSLKEVDEIGRITANFAKAGQGRESDAERARSETLLLRGQAEGVHEELDVAAAELARLLDLDPSLHLRSADPAPPLLELVSQDLSLPQLFEQALANHPEIVARSADVAYQAIRLRQERVRPWLPLIAVGFSAGEFGGGGPDTTSHLGSFSRRTDLDIVAVWSLQNLGVGNRAVQNIARSNLDSAWIERARLLDRIRREIAEAYALIEMRRQDMELARKRVETSQRAYTQDLTRTMNAQGRPIEVLNSANQLAAARQDLVRAMIGYSQAQLQLYVALGNAPAIGGK